MRRALIISLSLFTLKICFGESIKPFESAPVVLTSEERAWIANQPPLRVGTTPDWEPFSSFTPNGKAVGIDIDLLQIIAERTGLQFKIVPTESWEKTKRLAENGQIDLVTGIAETTEREKIFRFTRSYFESPIVIVSRENDHRFSHPSLLGNAVIAMPKRFVTTIELEQRLPSAKMILVDSVPECMDLVKHRKADVMIANLFVVSRYFNNHPTAKIAICGVIPGVEFPMRFGVTQNQPLMLTDILNKALNSISQSDLNNIVTRHLSLGLQGAYRTALLRKRITEVVIIAALVAATLGLFNYFSRKEINARRAAEAKLRQSNHSLEVFSHSISHDLRAPLRAISGFADVLKEDYGDKLDKEGINCIDTIHKASARMSGLISDVLAYTRTKHGQFPISNISLQSIVEQLISEFPVKQSRYFEIVSPLPDVQGNPTLLSQCLANLLSNAIKFVPKERTPKILIGVDAEEKFHRIWVEDNGIGIAPENHERIFKVFERLPNKDCEGTGIGLAVVQEGVQAMGGQFGVESKLGEGSRFWIRLPLAERRISRVTEKKSRGNVSP